MMIGAGEHAVGRLERWEASLHLTLVMRQGKEGQERERCNAHVGLPLSLSLRIIEEIGNKFQALLRNSLTMTMTTTTRE